MCAARGKTFLHWQFIRFCSNSPNFINVSFIRKTNTVISSPPPLFPPKPPGTLENFVVICLLCASCAHEMSHFLSENTTAKVLKKLFFSKNRQFGICMCLMGASSTFFVIFLLTTSIYKNNFSIIFLIIFTLK